MTGGRALAGWLLARREAIEAAMRCRLGASPDAAAGSTGVATGAAGGPAGAAGGPAGAAGVPAGAAEREALRRFRSFLLLALVQEETPAPALEGLKTGERRARRVLEAWLEAAAEAAGPDADGVRAALLPLAERFLRTLRETASARRASGAPRPGQRRVVSAAIDRVSDAFLAIDVETGAIADANPAAGALLGTTRDRLLGADAMTYVPAEARERWWVELDAVSEGAEPRRFRAPLLDSGGRPLAVDASITRFATRARTLALVLARS